MKRRGIGSGAVLVGIGLLLTAAPAQALVTRELPLGQFLTDSTYIFTAKVEAVDPDKLTMVLTLDENLKGKAPFQRLPMNLKGDSDSDKLKHRPLLLKRVAPKLPLVVFATKMDDEYVGFCYTNGTWFQIVGAKAENADAVRWSYTHIEPYLRRTFKGTTAEMKQVLLDAESGKKKPPPLNPKEEPGVGPEVEPEKPKECEARAAPLTTGPVFAVIPAVIVGGPLALLALLFPSVFGGWKRWLALISVTCTTSTLYFLHLSFSSSHLGAWWSSTLAYWIGMTLVTILGAFWAWQRHLRRVMFGEAPLAPGRIEQLVMAAVSVFALATLVYYRYAQQPLLTPDGMPVVVFCAGVWGGTLFAVVSGNLRHRMPALATEVVVLSAMALASTVLFFAGAGGSAANRNPVVVTSADERPPRLAWKFDLPAAGAVYSSPLVAGDRVYIAAAHDNVFRPYGVLYCLDRETGQRLWSFNGGGGRMKQVFSTPVLADGRLYVGEGFHQDSACRIFCLDAETGKKIWEHKTASHTESSPCVADGKVYCGAGDDGLLCLDAQTGAEVWHFTGYHVDAPPVVADGRVYCGAGVGDLFKQTIFFCLDAKDGREPLWRIETEQPVAGGAAVADGLVYFGIGNGRLNETAAKPAGAFLCVSARDGEEKWRYKLSDAVLSTPALDAGFVYFGCRDSHCYCLNRKTGKECWKSDLASPVVTKAALASVKEGGPTSGVYVAAAEGRLYCLAADTGKPRWVVDVGENLEATPELFSSPFVERVPGDANRRRLYFGVTLVTTSRAGSLVCYEEGEQDR